jgi:hypothetical protein
MITGVLWLASVVSDLSQYKMALTHPHRLGGSAAQSTSTSSSVAAAGSDDSNLIV